MLGRLIVIMTMGISLVAFGNECEERNLECIVPGGDRAFEGVNVYRDCWRYKYKLNCDRKSKNNCTQVPADTCLFEGEECIDKIKDTDVCINHRQKFLCEKEVEVDVTYEEIIKKGEKASAKDLMCKLMCLDGSCGAVKKASDEVNTELAAAASMLNMLTEMKKDMVGNELVTIFKGTAEKCDKKALNHLNCCKLSGWADKFFGMKCGAEAVNLAKKKQSKKCVEIGSFCKKKVKVLGVKKCIKRRTVFCCYDSLIGKIINQEVKKQLGRSNGTPENPNCGGVLVEDLAKVDLSKTDFSEFYNTIVFPNIRPRDINLDVKANTKTIKDITESNKDMPDRQGFNPNVKEVQ